MLLTQNYLSLRHMLKKLFLVYVLIFSYAGAVLHSIVPHHHHNSQQEAKEHHHHDHHAKHSHAEDQHNDNDKGHEQESSPYIFTHSANTDVLASHAYVDTVVKSKKADRLFALRAELPTLILAIPTQIFHPPTDDLITNSTAYLFGALRAPPTSFI